MLTDHAALMALWAVPADTSAATGPEHSGSVGGGQYYLGRLFSPSGWPTTTALRRAPRVHGFGCGLYRRAGGLSKPRLKPPDPTEAGVTWRQESSRIIVIPPDGMWGGARQARRAARCGASTLRSGSPAFAAEAAASAEWAAAAAEDGSGNRRNAAGGRHMPPLPHGMSAIGGKADIHGGVPECPLIATSGH